jgi:IPT/TIG domain
MPPIVRPFSVLLASLRSRTRRGRSHPRARIGLEWLEDRITPTTVTGVNPMTGPLGGGTPVTIDGTGFTGATAVDFGMTPGAITSISPNQITAYSPAGTGTVDVTVTSPGGTSPTTMADEFGYVATVSGVSPNAGPLSGGTLVTITGLGFTDATAVQFGTTNAAIASVSPTAITAYSPAGTGTVDVTVILPSGASPVSTADQFRFVALPAVTGVSPDSGPAAGGTTVTISGSGFTGATLVDFGMSPATSLTVVSDTSITASSPPGSGTVDVTVTTPGGTSAATASDEFMYVPSVSSVNPASGPASGGTPVMITGLGFTGVTAVDFGTTAAPSFTVLSNTTVTAQSPAGSGVVDVSVITSTGTSPSSPGDRFAYLGVPTVTGLSPVVGPIVGGTLVTITGTNLANATAIHFGTAAVASVVSDTASQLVVFSPLGPGVGPVNVIVTTPGGTSAPSPSNLYNYNAPIAPAVASISPNLGPPGGGTLVTIVGTGFSPGAPIAVQFGSSPATSVTVVSPTVITALSPAGTGAVDVTVISSSGSSPPTSGDVFTYSADGPRVKSVVRFGFHLQPTVLVITFDTPLDATSAQRVANYRILGSQGEPVKVRSARYSAATNTITLRFVQRLDLRKTYHLTINGTPPSGVKNPTGTFLDGAGDGAPGSNYLATVPSANLAGLFGSRSAAALFKPR